MQSELPTKHTKYTKVGPYGRNQTVFLFTKWCIHFGRVRLFSVARIFVCLVCFVGTPSELLRLSSINVRPRVPRCNIPRVRLGRVR
jgi:hypothetical protein